MAKKANSQNFYRNKDAKQLHHSLTITEPYQYELQAN